MFNYVPIKYKEMSFVSNGGKFKLYTVLTGLIFPTQDFIYNYTVTAFSILTK
jgi:hypothetical protein